MKRTISEHDFVEAFSDYGRGGSWSREARRALYEYLEEIENDTGEEIELDVIALDCDYTEYKTALEAAADYGLDAEDEADALDTLRDNTTVIEFNSGIIVQAF